MNEEPYDPITYWRDRGTGIDTGLGHPVHAIHFNNIKDILGDKTGAIHSVLEVGCGYGRITKMLLEYLPEIKKYDAIDVSPTRIEAALSYIPAFKYDSLNIWTANFEDTEFDTVNGYDLVISVECLMHQLPSKIEQWIHKMISYSRYYVMNLDWYEENYNGRISSWNFIHDYRKIYLESGAYMIEMKQISHNQCIFAVDISEQSWIKPAFTNTKELPSKSTP